MDRGINSQSTMMNATRYFLQRLTFGKELPVKITIQIRVKLKQLEQEFKTDISNSVSSISMKKFGKTDLSISSERCK